MLPLFLLLFPVLVGLPAQGQLTLTVQISGANQKGYLMAELRNAQNQVVQQRRQNLKADGASLAFTNLPKGRYAVAVFHDENGDGKLNTNLIGIPKERYGFSNNARGTFGPPDLEEQLVELSASRSISIQVK